MSIKFLYIGDAHERPTPPVNRKDNWEETYTEKVIEIRELAKKYKVKAILQGGDFLSSPKYNTEFLLKILNRWGYKNYNEALLREGAIVKNSDEAPLVGPIGNHVLHGLSLKNYDKTSLYFLEQIGFMTIPTKENPLVFKDEAGFTVAVSCGNYEIDMDETKLPYIVEDKKGDYHIHIVHGMLMHKKMMEGIPHTTIDEIKDKTVADLTIAGHDHTGFPTTEIDGKIFANPGAPIRLTTGEIKRKPKVMLIEIDENGIKTKNIYLKTAKEGSDVLDLTKKQKVENKKNILEGIKAKMENNSNGLSSIDEIIKSIAIDSGIDDEVSKKAVDRVLTKIELGETKSVEDESSNINQPYYIKRLILENYLSHEYSVFDFSEGMNVFVGATSSGKTSCFRAMEWIFDDKGNSKRSVKRGAEEARVTIFTSHGYIITRFSNPKKRKNGYEITYPDGHMETLNTKGVKVVQDILSYKKLDLENKKIDLNFLCQGVSWFFIGDNFTAGDRAKIIGSIYQTHFVDLAIKDLESESRKLLHKKEDKEEVLEKVTEKIKEFDYLDEMKKNLDELNALEAKLNKLLEEKEHIEALLNKKNLVENEIAKYDKIINAISLDEIKIAKEDLKQVELDSNTLKQIKNLADKRKLLESRIDSMNNILNSISSENLNEGKELLNNLKIENELTNKIKTLATKANKYEEFICKCDNILDKIDSKKIEESKYMILDLKNKISENEKIHLVLSKRKAILNEVKSMDNKLNQIKAEDIQIASELLKSLSASLDILNNAKLIMKKRNFVANEGKKMREEIDKANAILEKEILVYKDLLVQVGKCPICNSKIDAIVANKIVQDKMNKQ